jgi:hypothetical protein
MTNSWARASVAVRFRNKFINIATVAEHVDDGRSSRIIEPIYEAIAPEPVTQETEQFFLQYPPV